MAAGDTLAELERRIQGLSVSEQLLLVERLLHRMRVNGGPQSAALAQELAAMAADPDVRRELRAIQEEFAPAEEDGLEER
jgi:hypothetical protein